jgi:hypothetical protein
VTPASPSRARISRIATARSTDCTDDADGTDAADGANGTDSVVLGPPASLLLIAQRYRLWPGDRTT